MSMAEGRVGEPTQMPDPDQSVTEQLKAEVLRRIGRNLLIFQQIEALLKFLLIQHKTEGTPEDFQARHEKRAKRINKEILGNLVKEYVGGVLKDANEELPDEQEPRVTPYVSITTQIEVDAEFLEAMRRDLKFMTDERNELVHHFLPRWQPNSAEKLQESLDYLDAQRQKALPIHEHLRGIYDQLQENRKRVSEYLASDEYARLDDLMWLQSSPLVTFLRDISTQVRRADGWTYLAHAGQLAREKLKEDMQNLKERYGCSTLKGLLVACETFDIFDEPLSNGKCRTMYRVRPAN
jgi:hypothetical protein